MHVLASSNYLLILKNAKSKTKKGSHTTLFLMYKNCFWMEGGPCDTSGKQVASCDVNLSNGSLLWKAAPSSPVNTKSLQITITAFENLAICAWRGKFGKRLYRRWQEPCWALSCQKIMISVSESQLNLEFSGSDSSAKFDHCNIILIVKSTVIH